MAKIECTIVLCVTLCGVEHFYLCFTQFEMIVTKTKQKGTGSFYFFFDFVKKGQK